MTKKCRFCQRDLAGETARFCPECNHWQGFWLPVPQLELGDITVAVTLATLVFTVFRSTLFGDYADVKSTRLETGNRTLRVLFENRGRRDAVLYRPTASVEGSEKDPVQLKMRGDETSANVATLATDGPARLIDLMLSPDNIVDLAEAPELTADNCAMIVSINATGYRTQEKRLTLFHGNCKEFLQ